MSEWKPMHVEPPDAGIDLWSPSMGRITDCSWDWHGGCWKNIEGRFYEDDFTHWMLVPEPPK